MYGKPDIMSSLPDTICEKGDACPSVSAPGERSRQDRFDDLAVDIGFPREGLTSGHPDMPTFRFTREDARALTAYLRSIQAQ